MRNDAQEFQRRRSAIDKLMFLVARNKHDGARAKRLVLFAIPNDTFAIEDKNLVLVGMAVFRREPTWGYLKLPHGKTRSAVRFSNQPANRASLCAFHGDRVKWNIFRAFNLHDSRPSFRVGRTARSVPEIDPPETLNVTQD